jgi:hypothetical protein
MPGTGNLLRSLGDMAALRSGIGRPIDFSYPSNVYVVAVSAAAGVGAGVLGLVRGKGLMTSLGWGVLAGAASFLAWAVARELDPDHPVSAVLAAPLGAAALAAGPAGLGMTGVVLLTARIAARTTGLAPSFPDLVFVSGLSWYAATRPGGLGVAVVAGLALAADHVLPAGSRRRVAWGAAAVVAGSVVAAVLAGTVVPEPEGFDAGSWVLAGGALIGVLPAAIVTEPRSRCDITGEKVTRRRVRAARVAVPASVGAAALWGGGGGVAALGPVIAAVVAVALTGAALLLSGRE